MEINSHLFLQMFINSLGQDQFQSRFLDPCRILGQCLLLSQSRAHNRGQHQSQSHAHNRQGQHQPQSRAHNQDQHLFLFLAPNLLQDLSQFLFLHVLLLVPGLSLLDQDPFLLSLCPGSIAEGHGNRAPITTERGVGN